MEILQSGVKEILQSRVKEILQSKPREMKGRWQQQEAKRSKINWEAFQNYTDSEQEREPFQLLSIKTPREGA